MAAKTKAKGRPARSTPPGPPDIRHIFAVHLEASQRLGELLEEARQFQAAGKIRQARAVFKHAEEIQQHLTALEDGCRHPNKARDKRFV